MRKKLKKMSNVLPFARLIKSPDQFDQIPNGARISFNKEFSDRDRRWMRLHNEEYLICDDGGGMCAYDAFASEGQFWVRDFLVDMAAE